MFIFNQTWFFRINPVEITGQTEIDIKEEGILVYCNEITANTSKINGTAQPYDPKINTKTFYKNIHIFAQPKTFEMKSQQFQVKFIFVMILCIATILVTYL